MKIYGEEDKPKGKHAYPKTYFRIKHDWDIFWDKTRLERNYSALYEIIYLLHICALIEKQASQQSFNLEYIIDISLSNIDRKKIHAHTHNCMKMNALQSK